MNKEIIEKFIEVIEGFATLVESQRKVNEQLYDYMLKSQNPTLYEQIQEARRTGTEESKE